MPGFRLGAPALPAKDVAYIRALVRLFAYTEKITWSYVDKAPYTALVAPSDAASGSAPASLVLTLLDSVQEPHTIAYPIRADQLRDWLKHIGRSLSEGASGGAPAVPDLTTRMDRAQAVQAARAIQSDPSAQAGQLQAHTRYKLRRWPSLGVLGGVQLHIQMATFMSRRHVNVAELAGLSAASPDQALAFMHTLHEAGLLMAAPVAQVATGAAVEVPRTGFGIAGITSSLLDNIRRRIGM